MRLYSYPGMVELIDMSATHALTLKDPQFT